MRLFSLISLLLFSSFSAAQVTTAFTYQGQLQQSGAPATGSFDFEFVLYDQATDGTAVAGPDTVQDVAVSDGLFTTQVDFGTNVFGGTDKWMEVRVRDGGSTGSFTTLTPRQLVTPAPLAQHALNVEDGAIGSAQIVSGSITNVEIDETTVQRRVSGSCSAGDFITAIQADGTAVCDPELGDIQSVNAGSGLTGGASTGDATLSVNTSTVQSRVTGTCPPGLKLSGINADGSVACEVLPIGVNHKAANGKGDTSIALSADSLVEPLLPIVSYHDDTNGDLKVFDCTDAACSSGNVYTPDDGGGNDVGEYASIAVRQGSLTAVGLPIISYYDRTNGDLKAFDCDDPTCSTGTPFTLDGASGDDVGLYTSIAIRASGLPIISYYDVTNGDLKVFECDFLDCGSGTVHVLDGASGDDVGEYNSIAIRDSGNPIISYRDVTNADLKTFDCTDTSCSSGTARTLDGSGGTIVGRFTSIAVRDGGLPIIAYYDLDNSQLAIFECNDTACSSGIKDSVADSFASDTSIAIRNDGAPVISFGFAVKVYVCAPGKCLNTQPVTGIGLTRDLIGLGTGDSSIAIRPDGLPIISHDGINVFSCGDPDCLN